MDEESALLAELMLQSELFCSSVEARVQDMPPGLNVNELRLKIAHCRGTLSYLQQLYENEELRVDHGPTAAHLRQLVMSLMWVSFYGRQTVDFRLFRRLVQIESGFTYLLIDRKNRRPGSHRQ